MKIRGRVIALITVLVLIPVLWFLAGKNTPIPAPSDAESVMFSLNATPIETASTPLTRTTPNFDLNDVASKWYFIGFVVIALLVTFPIYLYHNYVNVEQVYQDGVVVSPGVEGGELGEVRYGFVWRPARSAGALIQFRAWSAQLRRREGKSVEEYIDTVCIRPTVVELLTKVSLLTARRDIPLVLNALGAASIRGWLADWPVELVRVYLLKVDYRPDQEEIIGMLARATSMGDAVAEYSKKTGQSQKEAARTLLEFIRATSPDSTVAIFREAAEGLSRYLKTQEVSSEN